MFSTPEFLIITVSFLVQAAHFTLPGRPSGNKLEPDNGNQFTHNTMDKPCSLVNGIPPAKIMAPTGSIF
jgi:hypothetical protein